MSYEIAVIDDPFKKETHEIYLVEKTVEVDEVAVVAKAGRYTRQQRLKAFKQQFIGDPLALKYCKIQNEDDIFLYYNEATRTLTAASEQPIIVENDYLGYRIHFTLSDFKISLKILLPISGMTNRRLGHWIC